MAKVFLINGASTPWAVPVDFITNSNHTVELVGAGGNGAVGTGGAANTSGAGGGSGGYAKCTYSSGTITAGVTTIPFIVPAGGVGGSNPTVWQTATNGQTAGNGGNAVTTTGGAAGATGALVGAPTIVYTLTANRAGAAGGAGSATLNIGGGGGAGAAGPAAAGGTGFSVTTSAGGGGGGANNGITGNAGSATGGTGSSGAGGTTANPGNPGTGNSGGGGGSTSAVAGTTMTGGGGGSGTDFNASNGVGGGGGGSGSNTAVSATVVTSNGGAGGKYGGGGGGCGGVRGTGVNVFNVGVGSSSLIVITFDAIWHAQDTQNFQPPSPIVRNSLRNSHAAAVMRGDDGNQDRFRVFNPNFDVQDAQDNLLRQWFLQHRNVGAIKSKSEFAYFTPFVAWNWEVQPPQPPHRRVEKAAGLKARSEFASFSLLPMGWEVQPWQPPHPVPEKRAAGILKGDEGNYDLFRVFNPNFDVQDAQDSSLKQWLLPQRRGAIARGDDGNQDRFRVFNPNFDVQDAQDNLLRQWSPLHRQGTIAKGDDGNQDSFRVFNPNFDAQDAQDNLLRQWSPLHRQGTIARGDDGSQSPFVFWRNAGWEVQPPQPPHRRVEKFGSIINGIDVFSVAVLLTATTPWHDEPYVYPRKNYALSGGAIKSKSEFAYFTPFVAWNWEVQPPQPPHPRVEKAAGLKARSEFASFSLLPMGWEVQPWQPPHRWFKQPENGDAGGIDAPFTVVVAFNYIDWPAPPMHKRPTQWRGGSIMQGDPGNEYPFINWFNMGFEQIFAQPPHRIYKSPTLGDPLGVDAQFAQWYNFGWEQVHALTRYRLYHTPDVGDQGTYSPFVVAFNYIDWPAPPMHKQPTQRRSAAFMQGDPGNEYPFINWFNMGFEQIFAQPPHPKYRSPEFGDASGIDSPFVQWYNAGWEVQYSNVRHPRYINFDDGDRGIQLPPVVIITWGWEFQSHQPRYQRHINLDNGDTGIEAPFIYITWGYDGPLHWFKPRRVGSGIFKGIDGTDAPFVNWINSGWEIQYGDVHFRPQNRAPAGVMRGIDGIEGPFSFWYNFGWEVQPPQPPAFASIHARMAAGFMQGDAGNQATIITFLPFGWEIQPPQPPSSSLIHARAGAIMQGDSGIYLPFNFVPPPPVTGLFMPGLFGATTHVGRAGYTPEPNP